MKKVVMLSAAALLAISSIAVSQAEEATTTADQATATVEQATPVSDTAQADEATATDATAADATVTAEQPAEATGDVAAEPVVQAEEAVPEDSPQVQKLMALYPNLVARIQPYGRVCFQGEDCDVIVTAVGGSADGEPRDGKAVYEQVCKTCHATGLLESPKLGDAGAWAPRIAQGADLLHKHALEGLNAMPAKGGADIPDEEVINAVDYMIEQSS